MLRDVTVYDKHRAYWLKKLKVSPTLMQLIHPHLAADTTVLDIGCGNGRLAAALAKIVHTAYALDYSQELVKAAKEEFSNLAFFCGDANNQDTWKKLPQFEIAVSNVAIRKDGCRLEDIVSQLHLRQAKCFFKIQSDRDLPNWLFQPPLYSESEIREYFSGWELQILEETYNQKFTDEAYFRTFFERIGLKPINRFAEISHWPARFRRHYYCIRAIPNIDTA